MLAARARSRCSRKEAARALIEIRALAPSPDGDGWRGGRGRLRGFAAFPPAEVRPAVGCAPCGFLLARCRVSPLPLLWCTDRAQGARASPRRGFPRPCAPVPTAPIGASVPSAFTQAAIADPSPIGSVMSATIGTRLPPHPGARGRLAPPFSCLCARGAAAYRRDERDGAPPGRSTAVLTRTAGS